MGAMKRRQLLSALPVATLAVVPGCEALGGLLPIIGGVISTVHEAAEVLDKIDMVTKVWFAGSPDPENEKKLAAVMGVARSLLNATLKTAEGAEHASKDEVDAAFDKFKEAYAEVLTVLTAIGFGLRVGGQQMMSAPKDGRPTIDIVAPDSLKMAAE